MTSLRYAVLSACAIAGVACGTGAAMADPDHRHKDQGAKVHMDRGDKGERDDKGDRGDRGSARIERRAEVGAEYEKRRDHNWKRSADNDRLVRRGHRYLWAPGFAFFLSDGYYYGNCGWLKRRAIETGNHMWWRRYERCRDFS